MVTNVKIRAVEEAAALRLVQFAGRLRRYLRTQLRKQREVNPKTIRVWLEKELLKIYTASYKIGVRDTNIPATVQLDIITDILRTATQARVFNVLRNKALFDAATETELMMTKVTDIFATVQAEELLLPGQLKALDTALALDGLSPVNPYHLETIARTSTNAFYNNAKYETLNDPDVVDIIWGYEYSTVGDSRVRPEHAAFDGVKLPKDDPFWETYWPPNGYNCRCTVLTIFTNQKSLQKPSTHTTPQEGVKAVPLNTIDKNVVIPNKEFQQPPNTFLGTPQRKVAPVAAVSGNTSSVAALQDRVAQLQAQITQVNAETKQIERGFR